MADFRRDLPHIYLGGNGRPEAFTSRQSARGRKLPRRNRFAHVASLKSSLETAIEEAAVVRAGRDPDLLTGTWGFYLDFLIPAGSEVAGELLESKRKGIELVSFRPASVNDLAVATVFVPDDAANHYLEKLEAYRTQDTKPRPPKKPGIAPKPPRPKNEDLIARIDRVSLAAVRSLYTDDPSMFPGPDEEIWWELWIRRGSVEAFHTVANGLGLPVQQDGLVFPDREVRLVYCDLHGLGKLYLNSSSIAEIRRAKDTPAEFLRWPNTEQSQWSLDLAGRVIAPSGDVSVCVLDTGVTREHPLLAPAIDSRDVHQYDPAWQGGDHRGHGTNMAGTAIYGDLLPLLESSTPVVLTHCLESVKVLPDAGENEPKLYGAITKESVARAELGAPDRRRAVCLAVTSDIGTNRGRPSSWSAAVDQLCFGDESIRRLVLISAGNIRDGISQKDYPARNDTEPVENPGQAWNAITVGAFTEKTVISDPSFAGWEPVAPDGELSPGSRTSVGWERQWPIKPEVLMEGGNWASSGDLCDCPDDLGLLTTYRDPTTRHFDIFRETSAATALASNLAGRITAAMPRRWPETIRALLVHSAEWTPAMKRQFDGARTETQKRALLRKYGYGVPSYDRAVLSAANDLTLIACHFANDLA